MGMSVDILVDDGWIYTLRYDREGADVTCDVT